MDDRRFFRIILLALLIVTSLPTAYGYLSTPPDRWFSGVVYNMHDTAQYLTWTREAAHGLFTRDMLTPEPSAAIFCNLHWWLVGKVMALTGLGFRPVYALFRLVAVALLVWVSWAWMGVLFPRGGERRRVAFLLSLIGGGLGWIWVVVKYLTPDHQLLFPRDLYTTPGNHFWVMVASPHLTLAAALTLAVLLWGLRAAERGGRWVWATAALALFLGLGHIYDLVTVWAVLALFGLLLLLRGASFRETLCRLGPVVLLSLPAPLYWGWVASPAHPVWYEALKQYDNLGAVTPDPLHLLILLGAGFLLAAATYDGFVPLEKEERPWLLVKSWFVLVPLLVYLPVQFRIMLLTGYALPVSALAVRGLYDHVLPWLEARGLPRRRQGLIAAFLLFAALTNLYLLGWRFLVLHRHEPPFYLHRDEVAALEWLDAHGQEGEVVLSSFTLGYFVPGMTGLHPVLGSAVMTLDFNEKRQQVEAFFDDGMSEAERQAFLRRYGVDFVFCGPQERALGNFCDHPHEGLRPLFEQGEVRLYAVER